MDYLNEKSMISLIKLIVSKTHNINIEKHPTLYGDIIFIIYHFWNSLLELNQLEQEPYRFSSAQSTWIIKISLTYIEDYMMFPMNNNITLN